MVDVATLIQNNVPVPLKILFRLLRMRMLIRLILVLAIVLGIIGAVRSFSIPIYYICERRTSVRAAYECCAFTDAASIGRFGDYHQLLQVQQGN